MMAGIHITHMNGREPVMDEVVEDSIDEVNERIRSC